MSDYQIGQYRFSGSSQCLTDVSASLTKGYASVNTSEGDGTFKDLQVKYNGEFSPEKDYYLYMKIPQNMNYDYTFTLKLMRENDTTSYQYLDTITIPKGGNGNNAYNVVLYAIPGTSPEQVKAMIPNVYNSEDESVLDELYLDAASGRYYVGIAEGAYEQIIDYNDMFMDALWRYEFGDYYGWFELTFRPINTGFTRLVLEMTRTGTDWNIQNGDGSFGRLINVNDVEVKLSEMTNLVGSIHANGTLSKIGVWGHPDLMMAINGETIRVGRSGYYEFDTIPIESIGIVARGFEDNFTLDWMYKAEEGE